MIDQFDQDGREKLFGEAFASVVAGEIHLVDPFDLLQIASFAVLVSRSGDVHQSLSHLSFQKQLA